jgi:transcriptional regulator with XRE-family HTH domain
MACSSYLNAMPKNGTLSTQLRHLIDQSGMSRYRICNRIGLAESAMSRFMSGERGLSMEVLDRLFSLLNLRVVAGQASERKRRAP